MYFGPALVSGSQSNLLPSGTGECGSLESCWISDLVRIKSSSWGVTWTVLTWKESWNWIRDRHILCSKYLNFVYTHQDEHHRSSVRYWCIANRKNHQLLICSKDTCFIQQINFNCPEDSTQDDPKACKPPLQTAFLLFWDLQGRFQDGLLIVLIVAFLQYRGSVGSDFRRGLQCPPNHIIYFFR